LRISAPAYQNIGTSAAHVIAREAPINPLLAPTSFSRNKKRKFSITPVHIPLKITTAKNRTLRLFESNIISNSDCEGCTPSDSFWGLGLS
jgi:hypothetical protein